MSEILVFVSFISVGILFIVMAAIRRHYSKCISFNGKHNWKRISYKYLGDKIIPDTIILHLKCDDCGKEITKTYQI